MKLETTNFENKFIIALEKEKSFIFVVGIKKMQGLWKHQ